MKLFSVLDVKAKHFMKPMADTSVAQAIRAFTMAANEKGCPFNDFPDDFALMELGEMDIHTGAITPLANPVNLGTARTYLRENVVTQ